MFRLTHFLRQLERPTPPRKAAPPGPVVIWNLTRRCNLTCKHCYAIAADRHFPGELSQEQLLTTMDDLRDFGVPVLILSGGEPLLHPDIWTLSERARAMGFYVALSTNGVPIDASVADRIAAIGYDYVGISLDGIGATHDKFRRRIGAFDASLNAVRLCVERGIKVGLRFTLTQDNEDEFPQLLSLMRREGVQKFYLSHLNYGGRGNVHRADDSHFQTTRRALDLLIETAWSDVRAGADREYVTGNNDADGVYLWQWVRRRFPEAAEHVRAHLTAWGGNASGVHVANIDNLGNVHPDTFWWHHTLGNVKQRPFSAIWQDLSDPLLAGLKQRPRPLHGRCGACVHAAICGGNTRVRAQQLSGDPWAEDPGCYLTDQEIGVTDASVRAEVVPFRPRERDQDRRWVQALKRTEQSSA